MAAKIYSDEEIECLSKNPCVLHVSRRQMSLTLEFRQRIYDEWEKNPVPSTVKRVLEENGFDTHEIGVNFYKNIALVFKKGGRPKFSKSPSHDAEGTAYGGAYGENSSMSSSDRDNGDANRQNVEQLLESGKFVRRSNGIWFAPDFEKELYDAYPGKSVQQSLVDAGFRLVDVGCHRVYRLEKSFREKRGSIDNPNTEGGCRTRPLSSEAIEKLRSNPYVECADTGGVILREEFFPSAAPLSALAVDEILSVFLIDGSVMSFSEKAGVAERLGACRDYRWKPVPGNGGSTLESEMLRRREAALERVVLDGYDRIAETYKASDPMARKKICLVLDSIPKDPAGRFTKSSIIERLGIPRNSYYLYVGNEEFGTSRQRRMEMDGKDMKDIRMVFDYKGFRKGLRQVYMLLPRLTGRKLGLKRIRRLMKLGGMDCGVRGPNPARRRASEREKASVKPNLLRRRFRLYRPNRVRVTDVTVLVYGGDAKAYGSALMDPVTGRLIAFAVSENENLELAIETLRQSDAHPCEDGGIFHSDQGILYKTPDFQKAVLSRGLNQSMSKKGNCWDNATQESFFGHFKDECDYGLCDTIDELKKKVAEYSDYYNNERGMWDKGRMTPVEYEKHLSSMDEEEFAGYLGKEEDRYKKMKERAAELAKKRYGTLGV